MSAEGTMAKGWTARTVPPRLATLHVLWLPVIAGFMSGWAGINVFSVAPRFVSAIGGSLLALVCWMSCHATTLMVQRLTGGRLPLVPLLALGVLASGILIIPGYYAVYELFHRFGWATKGWAAIHDYSFGKGLAATPGTMLFWVSFNYMLVRFGVPRFGFGGPAPAPPATPDIRRPALDPIYVKMRPEVRGPILAVQAEAHFIRVYTTRGQDLIHHRFGDAVQALAALGGERVHRSWWVAADAIDQRASSGALLRLVNGVEVPVGRTYMMDARRAGMLA
jgi:hypothetical protein